MACLHKHYKPHCLLFNLCETFLKMLLCININRIYKPKTLELFIGYRCKTNNNNNNNTILIIILHCQHVRG